MPRRSETTSPSARRSAARGRGSPANGCEGRECGLVRHFFTLHHMLMRTGDRAAASIGLTAARWLLLCAASRTGEPRTVGRLSEDAMMSVQNTSRMIASMEDEGLVRRATRRGAGRAVFVELTAKGRKALERTEALAERFDRVFLAGFAPCEIDRLRADLERLIANLHAYETELEKP